MRCSFPVHTYNKKRFLSEHHYRRTGNSTQKKWTTPCASKRETWSWQIPLELSRKMAVLCWVVLVLAVFLSPQCSLAAVDEAWLTDIIQNLKNEYELGDSYSLVVNLPVNQDISSLAEVLKDDPADAVKQAISTGQGYQGTRVVAAAQSGALAHVLEKIQPLIKSSDGNVLIVYSEGYPDANGIDNKISNIVQNWKSYAFVFSKVADVADADTLARAAMFKEQEVSKFGLENIFRCYEQSDSFQCTNCKAGDNVAPSCVADTMQSGANEETAVGATEPPTGSDEGTISGLNNESDIGTIAGTDQDYEGGGMIDVMGGQEPRKGKTRQKGKRGGEVKEGGKRGKGGKMRKSRRRGEGSKMRKSRRRGKRGKMRKSRRRGKGGKMRKSRRRGKGGKMRKSRGRGKRGKMRKSRRRGKGGKMRKSRRRGKGGKMRKSRRRGKGGKMRKSRRRGKGGKMRKSRRRGKGGKMRKSRRRGKGGKMRKSRRRGKGGKMRKSRRRGKGGKMRKSRRRRGGRRRSKRRG
ncbi:uncharacterized protein LOC111608595 [Xiphophorus maculatus]|uniref:uncharacterized protein LOC111608595 n=1 Tax=Xiphophorus maculatus TaxID=8083 RepID=UPI000C6EC736|nr:uncharacterized protein LOC111608595 [Xiphophorus maculatus]